ncbi:hypothetical protein WDW37_07960 [Bdellovibrionota bacterium FG-1]
MSNHRLNQSIFGLLAISTVALQLGGCAQSTAPTPAPTPNPCASSELSPNVSGGTGTAKVFSPDPILKSGDLKLAPTSLLLDNYTDTVTLQNLLGYGVLKGAYVDVRNGTTCNAWYGAYDKANQFSYPHSDFRFQEAMAYYWGDQYRSRLDTTGYLLSQTPVIILAHCQKQDNAFFVRGQNSNHETIEEVCLGDSVATEGASYSDDGVVTIHELQHATTTDSYSATEDLNKYYYDEAGALNEAISDFMALMFEEPLLDPFLASMPGLNPRLFSRWALGTFIPHHVGTRGADKCPAYDAAYPQCTGYPGFSGANNTVSYVYPDGLGWPYANNYQGPGYVANAFSTYKSQEEIHNAGVLMEGALWDVYEALKTNYSNDQAKAELKTTQLVMEAVTHLPKKTATLLSPITFREMASQIIAAAPLVNLSAADQTSITTALTNRGIYGGTDLDATWAAVGSGIQGVTPGLRVQDNPTLLKTWLTQITGSSNVNDLIPQGITEGLNGQLDPGELVAVWFDIQNTAAQTAGGVQLTVTTLDPEITFDTQVNMSNSEGFGDETKTQMIYGKINGTNIVTSLSSANSTYSVATASNYFKTNPFFDHDFTTALWVRVSAKAAHGKTVRFQVVAKPSNGAAVTLIFPATIN